jgi:hypothetical protein
LRSKNLMLCSVKPVFLPNVLCMLHNSHLLIKIIVKSIVSM